MTTREYMPIMGTGLAVRMGLLNEEQAQRNHYQSLDRLAQRGGLSACEALAICERRKWAAVDVEKAVKLLSMLAQPSEVEKAARLPE